MDLKIEDEEQTRMLNGRCVTAALTNLNNEATKEQLLKHFMSRTDQPCELIEEEVNLILENGVSEGFIMKCGNRYLLTSQWNAYEVDISLEDAETRFKAAWKELESFPKCGKYIHELLMLHIVYEAMKFDRENTNSVLALFTDETSKSTIANCYKNACNLVEIMRNLCRKDIRGICHGEAEFSKYCKLRMFFEDDVTKIKNLDDQIVFRTVLNFEISKVQTAIKKHETPIRARHHDDRFAASLKDFIDSAYIIAKNEKHFDFSIEREKKKKELIKDISQYNQLYRLYDSASSEVDPKHINEVVLGIIIDDAVLNKFTKREDRLLNTFVGDFNKEISELHRNVHDYYDTAYLQVLRELISKKFRPREPAKNLKAIQKIIAEFKLKEFTEGKKQFLQYVNKHILLILKEEGVEKVDEILDREMWDFKRYHNDNAFLAQLNSYILSVFNILKNRRDYKFEIEAENSPEMESNEPIPSTEIKSKP